MNRCLIIGASGGIGAALADAIPAEHVVRVSRSVDGLDVTDPASVDRVLGGLDPAFDLIIVATGVLGVPEKSLAAIDAAAMVQVITVNTIGPALVLRHVPRLLSSAGKVAVLSARVGSISDNRLGGWHSYRASKAAVNQIIRGAAIELKRTHKGAVCVALHPGTVATPFTQNYAVKNKTSPAEAARKLLGVINGLQDTDTGQFFDAEGKAIDW